MADNEKVLHCYVSLKDKDNMSALVQLVYWRWFLARISDTLWIEFDLKAFVSF